MKNKLLEIYNDYLNNAKEMLGKFKYKLKGLKKNFKKNLMIAIEGFKDPKTIHKYMVGLLILVVLNLFIINLFTSYAYYNDSVTIPILSSKVGDFSLGDYDYILEVYLENVDNTGDGNGKYHLASTIPNQGYTFSGYKCNNGSTLNYDDNAKTTTVTIKEREKCSIYFDTSNPFDIVVNILLEETKDSNSYIMSNQIPAYGYRYSHYECNNGASLEYDSNNHRARLETNNKENCSLYFKKEASDIDVNLHVENTVDMEDYITRTFIPANNTYTLNTSRSFCKNTNKERIDNADITYEDGYINVSTLEVSECEIYLDKNA